MLYCISCKKEGVVKPYTVVSVKFIGDEDSVFIELTEGSWDNNLKQAQLNATGYKNERFSLYLVNLIDTGYYPTPSIRNISYTDGMDFLLLKLDGGYIHISYIDTLTVRGDFKVTLEDNFNGADIMAIVGGFDINIHYYYTIMEFPYNLKYSKEHIWLLKEGDTGTVGITKFAQNELGEIVYVDLPAVGKSFKQDEVFGSAEAIKTVSDLFMPASGEVIAFNNQLKKQPTLVNDDNFVFC
jgi:glycine cleavage system H protein